MVKPLNESTSIANFPGSTVNNHPEWHNTPLRLNEHERNNPQLVLQEFFQCYRLQIVREIMWGWSITIVSSPGSISANSDDRKNHIFFYEKIKH
jgi:hypothetical protein